MEKSSGAFIIGWDFSEENERDVLIVMQGGQMGLPTKIINAFYDEEAHLMYERLTRGKEKEV